VILVHYKIEAAFVLYGGSLLDSAFVMWCKIVVNIKYTGFKGQLNADFSVTDTIQYKLSGERRTL